MKVIKQFKDQKVRVVLIDEVPYFAATDVCKSLEIKNSRQALTYLDKDDVITNDTIDNMGRSQSLNYVNEGGLYQLIFRSRKKESIKFKKWITHEVLPSLRKTGRYSIPDKLKKDSTKSRNLLTGEWKRHGIEKPNEYIKLTLQEYKSLNIEDGKRKKDFDYYDMLRLTALESMESLKLFSSEISGIDECSNSLKNTANMVKQLQENS